MNSEREQLIQLFDAKVQSFDAAKGRRFQALLPFQEGVLRLRKKGASSRTIAELLKQLGVTVSHNTIARFCRELADSAAAPDRRAPAAKSTAPMKLNPPSTSVAELLNRRHENGKTPEATGDVRRRGPRIADPKNV